MDTNSMNNIDIELGSKLNLNNYNKKSNYIGCRLVPKDNKYSSTESTRVPTTESDNVLLNTSNIITKNKYSDIIEQDTKENHIDTELKDEDFVFSDYKSYKEFCNKIIEKYNLEFSRFSNIIIFNSYIINFPDNECKSFVKILDYNRSIFDDRVINELRLLKCYTKDKKIFKDKQKRTKVINKLKMLPEIKKKYEDMSILSDNLNWKSDEALMKSHDEKMKMINEIINALSKGMLRLIFYNKRLYDTGFFTTLINNLSKLHPDDYYCKMMGIRFSKKKEYKNSRNFFYKDYY